jgi:hypothetical protein
MESIAGFVVGQLTVLAVLYGIYAASRALAPD